MRKRRSAAVFAGVLLAHIGLAVAWLVTHPPPRFVEPVTLQIELIRPERHKPPPRPARPTSTAIRLHAANPATPPPVAPLLAPPPPIMPSAAPPGPHILSDEELLAAPKPSIRQLREGPIRDAANSGASLRPCKPANERTANDPSPPCPVIKETEEGRRKEAVRAYRGSYGSSGTASVNDYPGLRCTFAHVHCGPADPSMDPLHPPSREH